MRTWIGRLGILALAAFTGCSSNSDEGPSAPAPVSQTLSDGVQVQVDGAGAIRLVAGEQDIQLTSASGAPTVRRFDAIADGLFSIWEFSRENEEVFPLRRVAAGASSAEAVELKWAQGDVRGTVTVTPHRPGTTRVVFEATGLADATSLAIPLACDPGATFFGFGAQYESTDQRGEVFDLFVSEQGIGRKPDLPAKGVNGGRHTTYFPMPYFVDARGFGVLAMTDHRVRVDLCSTDADVAWVEVIDGAPLELLVFHGPTPKDVIEQLSEEVGRPASPPDWAYELWIGAQGGRDAVLAEADALEAADIPVGALWVQDWTGQRDNIGGGSGVQYRWVEDKEFYPDLAGMIDELGSRGYRFLAYANPFVDPNLDHYDEMDANGWLIQDEEGESYLHVAPIAGASHPELLDDGARDYVRGHLERMVTELGIDGWMADFGEWVPLDVVPADGSDPIAYHNRYPVLWHTVNREAMEAARPDGDWVLFARSGWTGVHAVSQIHWIGDQEATWDEHDGLPTVVPAMVNLGLSGIPYVTHDIAGFSGGPSTKELFQRWTELGAFTPVMRTHEGNNKDENWSWEKDTETTEHFRRFARIHQALVPEIRGFAAEAAASSVPIVRHLMLEFPDDVESRGVDDQFMLGEALLVAPVVKQGATTRELYLPPGTWYHVWTGDSYEGGQRVQVDAPIGSPPVFSLGQDRPDLRGI
ncbi:MAG: TIM-barrel domain-containing protein [Myxococcota bacterium]